MSEQTKIQWADSTVNFWSGCTKVSPGCKNCYAEAMSNRKLTNKAGELNLGQWGKGAPRQRHESAFKLALQLNNKPLICDHCGVAHNMEQAHWCEPIKDVRAGDYLSYHRRRVFSLSLGDWLDRDETVDVRMRAEMLHCVWRCSECFWLLCTKRPELWRECLQEILDCQSAIGSLDYEEGFFLWVQAWLAGQPPKYIMVLASVENQQAADERLPALLKIPASKRGLSCEPLLGPVDFPHAAPCGYYCGGGHRPGHGLSGIDWVIIGGESGPKARTCDLGWIRSLVAQGKAAGVATFVKQLGSNPSCECGELPHDLHPKGGDMAEWPKDLQVREFYK